LGGVFSPLASQQGKRGSLTIEYLDFASAGRCTDAMSENVRKCPKKKERLNCNAQLRRRWRPLASFRA
jgi:hypothetical protein